MRNFDESFAEGQHYKISLFLDFLDNSLINVTSWGSVDFSALKPCCQSHNILFVSRWVMMFLTTMCSSSLQHMHVNETGLYNLMVCTVCLS